MVANSSETPRHPKYTAKDSVFRALFEEPRYLFQMYHTLHPEDDKITATDLKIVTLQQILCNGPYNDLGFIAGDRLMILIEAQSTWSPNIVIRSLIYTAITYQEYFDRQQVNLYGHKPVHLPRPELYVIYTGKETAPEPILSLTKDFFNGIPAAIDACVKVIDLDDSDSIINQYIIFCQVFNEQKNLHGRTKKAIEETIRICTNLNVLKEFLESRRTEVEGIMFTLFDQDRINELALIEERKASEDRATFKTLKRNVESMMKNFGVTAAEAIAALDLTPADSKRLTAMLNC